MNYPRVRFQGNEYLLIGDLENGGPIATKGAYELGEASYAHLSVDGAIRRFKQVIGHKSDLEFIGETDVTPDGLESLVNILTHPSWGGPWVAAEE